MCRTMALTSSRTPAPRRLPERNVDVPAGCRTDRDERRTAVAQAQPNAQSDAAADDCVGRQPDAAVGENRPPQVDRFTTGTAQGKRKLHRKRAHVA